MLVSIIPKGETNVQSDFFNVCEFAECWLLIVAGVEVEDLTLDNVSDFLDLSVRVS